jgi:hypothetical protein
LSRLNFEYEFDELRTLLRSHGFEGPIWQGECGYPSTEDTAGFRGTGPWGEQIQAKFVLRRLLTDWCAGADVSTYFMLVDGAATVRTAADGSAITGSKNTKGLLTLEDLAPKPAYGALQHLCAMFDGVSRDSTVAHAIEVVEAGVRHFYPGTPVWPARLTADDVAFHAFRAPSGHRLFAYWVPMGMRERVRPGKVILRVAAKMASPVLVDLLDGSVCATEHFEEEGQLTFPALPLTDYPLVVADRADVPVGS